MLERTIESTDTPDARMSGPRRSFLARALGIGAGAVGLAGAGKPAARPAAVAPAGVTDADIMNFALNLEYLEAEFYTYAVTGAGIEALGIPVTGANTGAGDPGPIIIKGGSQVQFTNPAVRQYAMELAVDEQKHVVFFRNALAAFGVQPAARPTIDLQNSFNLLAKVAGLPTPFDPFLNDTNFLLGAYIFEDVGVSAFHGAAKLIQNKNVLDAAAGILAVEAYHAGLIRTLLFQQGLGAATDAISGVRQALGGSTDYGVDNGPLGMGPKGNSSVVLADANAMAAERTPQQVLNIVYGSPNTTPGLFFPNGLNGKVR